MLSLVSEFQALANELFEQNSIDVSSTFVSHKMHHDKLFN